ncbi:MAG TPA: metal-dependent hydrolase [Bryobacterales bacterium]|nr:metal-dependent hydrolase [Bryobacterales bacterium]
MDALTDTAVAIAIGMAGHRRWGRTGTLWLIAAANLPQLERVVAAGSLAAWMRVVFGAGHSLFTTPLLGLALAAPLARRLHNWKAAATIVGLGLGSHLALDLLSGPGVRLFWPLSSSLYGFDLLADYDLLTLAVLAFALIGPQMLNLVNQDIGAKAYSPQKPARAGLLVVALLIALRAGTMLLLEDRAESPAASVLSPSQLNPLTWYVITDAGTAYTVDEITPWGNGPSLRFRKAGPNRAFETAADTPLAEAFLEMARFPQYSLERGEKGMLVRLRDLRFYTPAGEGKEYSIEIEVTPQLQVVSEKARM